MVPLLCVVPRRMLEGADRRSLIREFRAIKRMSAADRPLQPGAFGERPLIVLTPGRLDGFAGVTEMARAHQDQVVLRTCTDRELRTFDLRIKKAQGLFAAVFGNLASRLSCRSGLFPRSP